MLFPRSNQPPPPPSPPPCFRQWDPSSFSKVFLQNPLGGTVFVVFPPLSLKVGGPPCKHSPEFSDLEKRPIFSGKGGEDSSPPLFKHRGGPSQRGPGGRAPFPSGEKKSCPRPDPAHRRSMDRGGFSCGEWEGRFPRVLPFGGRQMVKRGKLLLPPLEKETKHLPTSANWGEGPFPTLFWSGPALPFFRRFTGTARGSGLSYRWET